MKTTIKAISIAITCATALNAFAGDEAMLNKLREHYPKTSFSEVNQSEVKGVYEVVMGKNIAYTDDSGRYFVFGHMFDMVSQADLTAARKEQLNRVEWPKAHLKNAIKIVKGKGERSLAVFSDPDCPFCKQLEGELAKLDNVTIYVFLYPIDSLHPDARQKAVSIWCDLNQAKAWTDWMLGGKEPKLRACINPINDNVALAMKYNVTGTPTLISEDGRVLPGAVPASRIEAWLGVKS